MNGDGNGVGAYGCLDFGSVGELGGLEPIVNLVLDFWLSLYLCLEAESGEGVLDEPVRSGGGYKNGGEKGGSPPDFWNRLSDELRCRFEGARFGCDCRYWYGFRWEGLVVPIGGAPVGSDPEA